MMQKSIPASSGWKLRIHRYAGNAKERIIYNSHFEPGLINRDDIDDIPLHPQCAALPKGKILNSFMNGAWIGRNPVTHNLNL